MLQVARGIGQISRCEHAIDAGGAVLVNHHLVSVVEFHAQLVGKLDPGIGADFDEDARQLDLPASVELSVQHHAFEPIRALEADDVGVEDRVQVGPLFELSDVHGLGPCEAVAAVDDVDLVGVLAQEHGALDRRVTAADNADGIAPMHGRVAGGAERNASAHPFGFVLQAEFASLAADGEYH